MEAAEEAAAEQLGEAMRALEAQKRNSIYEGELSAAALADLQEQFEDLHRQHSELADVHSSSASEIRALQVGRQLSSARRLLWTAILPFWTGLGSLCLIQRHRN